MLQSVLVLLTLCFCLYFFFSAAQSFIYQIIKPQCQELFFCFPISFNGYFIIPEYVQAELCGSLQ